MPEYIYRCKEGHEVTVSHGMTEIVNVVCSTCGGHMKRRPQPVRINWAGFRYERSPEVKAHLEKHA